MFEKLKNIEPKAKLRVMYLYNICTLLPFGLFMLILPDLFVDLFGWPSQNPYVFGIASSVWIIFGFLSVFGYAAPERYIPVLLLQLFYKLVWLFAVFLVNALLSTPPIWAIILAIIMTTYIIGDVLVIPFKTFFTQ